MAKVSKKNTASPSLEADNLSQYFREWIDDAGIFLQHEPIAHIPNVDMFSTNSELVIEVEMPGVRREDIEITLHKNTLAIKAIKFECFEEDKINYVCMERSFGKLSRTIEIPFPVDTVRVKASYKNGILTIIIPRVADKRSHTKKVPIESI
jgi:HSP20 family protein